MHVVKPLKQNTRVRGVIIPNKIIPQNTLFIEIDSCKNPMFLVVVDKKKHFGASKDVYMLCLVCTLVLSVLNVAPKVRRGKTNFLPP
jgi:hypothetical protein